MKKEIIIKVDTNDGDYVISIEEIMESDLFLLMPLIERIKENKGRFEYGEMFDCYDVNDVEGYNFSEKIMEMFIDFCPSPEHGFHTIENITISPIVEKKELWNRWKDGQNKKY